MVRRVFAAVSSVAVVAASAMVSTVRALEVSELNGISFEPCTENQLASFSSQIVAESNDCAARSSYDWSSNALPTTLERQELCACTSLMSKLQTVKVPYCAFLTIAHSPTITDSFSYKYVLEYAFDLCTSTTTATPRTTTPKPTTGTATPTPTTTLSYDDSRPTYAPYTYAPSFDLDTSKSSTTTNSKSKAGLIVGVVAALAVIAALVVFVVRRNKKQQRVGGARSSRKGGHSSHSEIDDHVAPVAVSVEGPAELSPLGADSTYAEMPRSPSAPAYKDMV